MFVCYLRLISRQDISFVRFASDKIDKFNRFQSAGRKELNQKKYIRKVVLRYAGDVSPDDPKSSNGNVEKFGIQPVTAELKAEFVVKKLKEYEKWSIKKKLLKFDSLDFHKIRNLNGARILANEFVQCLENMNPNEIMQALYYITNFHFKLDETKTEFLQNKFDELFNDLTLDQISVWCNCFDQLNILLEINHWEMITEKIATHKLDELEDTGVNCIVKALRHNLEEGDKDVKSQLLGKCVKNLIERSKKSNDLLTFIGILRLLRNCELLDVEFMRISFNKIFGNVYRMRYKDLRIYCEIISQFQNLCHEQDAKKLLHQILSYLKFAENDKFMTDIYQCIHYLSLCSVYDTELIDWALSPLTLKTAFGNVSKYDVAVIHIDMFAKLILGNRYNGNRLNENDFVAVAERNREVDIGHVEEVKKLLEKTGRKPVLIHVLPHYSLPGNERLIQLIVVNLKK